VTQAQAPARRLAHIDYKWIALSNTTLGILMAALNSSIVLIALPDIFRGIGIDPLAPAETSVLLWSLMGYLVVTAVLLVTCGRLSDVFGRVRLYNLGFLIFTLGSILLFVIQGRGNVAAIQLIGFRIVQGIGGAFLFANSTAILTDAFSPSERGFALGINQMAGIAGSFVGLVTINWRAVFLVSVPIGIVGTVWAYLMLHETAKPRTGAHLDVAGNLLFAGGLTSLLVALTYGIQPYGGSDMGWGNPWVIAGLVAGVLMLAVFAFVETRVAEPMFRLDLFRNRPFAMHNAAGFLASVGRGGLQFMIIIWLQGVWLPLHGYSFERTPLWAGIYMIPLTVGFLVIAPIGGWLSDRHGARELAAAGMVVTALGFAGLTAISVDFAYPVFAALLLVLGIGMGLFTAPNTTAIMNAVPAAYRGVASGMRATFQNVASTLSITVIFSLVTVGLAKYLPESLMKGLTGAGIPADAAAKVAELPPVGALFAAFLGYNPLGTLIPSSVLGGLSAATRGQVLGTHFFPTLLSGPFKDGVTLAFLISAALSIVAAVASLAGGRRYVHDAQPARAGAVAEPKRGTS
jgi:MFS family permease